MAIGILTNLVLPPNSTKFCLFCLTATRNFRITSLLHHGHYGIDLAAQTAIEKHYFPKKVEFKKMLPETAEEPEVVNHFPKKEELQHCDNLLKFFEPKNMWGEGLVRRSMPGQSWTVSILRLKSNVDLHKLWYVLMMERNMLLTLDRECEESEKETPWSERVQLVEQSMDNILKVVQERDEAYTLLEEGRGKPKGAYAWDIFGFRYWKW